MALLFYSMFGYRKPLFVRGLKVKGNLLHALVEDTNEGLLPWSWKRRLISLKGRSQRTCTGRVEETTSMPETGPSAECGFVPLSGGNLHVRL